MRISPSGEPLSAGRVASHATAALIRLPSGTGCSSSEGRVMPIGTQDDSPAMRQATGHRTRKSRSLGTINATVSPLAGTEQEPIWAQIWS